MQDTYTVSVYGEARQSKAKQGKARQSKAKQGKARQSKARQSKAKQGKARQSKARQSKAKQGKARQTNKTHLQALFRQRRLRRLLATPIPLTQSNPTHQPQTTPPTSNSHQRTEAKPKPEQTNPPENSLLPRQSQASDAHKAEHVTQHNPKQKSTHLKALLR